MIDLYTAATPNGRKVSIMLEELGMPYRVHALTLGNGDQHKPEFLALNPNGKIPAIIDDGVKVFESGAILLHLAEKTGRLLPERGQARADAMAWLMFQMGGIGPIMGQAYHFANATEQVPYAIKRFGDESRRLLGVLDGRLADNVFLAGADYSVADIANYPWVKAGIDLLSQPDEFTDVRRWLAALAARPSVDRGMAVPS